MKHFFTLVLLFITITVSSQSREWFKKNYPIDCDYIRGDNHNVVKAKVIDIDKKTIKPDYLIKILINTIYKGKVDSSVLLVNVAMPAGQVKQVYKNAENFIMLLRNKDILLNIWEIDIYKDNDQHRISKYWTSAYSFFINGFINENSYIDNPSMAVFTDSPSLFIADLSDYYFLEEVTTAFYKAIESKDCSEISDFIYKYKKKWGVYRTLFISSATLTYISDCKCE